MSDELLKRAMEFPLTEDAPRTKTEPAGPHDGPDMVLLAEALAQVDDRDRTPPVQVIRHLVEKHGISWEQAVAEIKSFATGH